MDKIQELVNIVNDSQIEATKFYTKGNKSAAIRLRKNMQIIKKLAQEIRFDVQETKHNL